MGFTGLEEKTAILSFFYLSFCSATIVQRWEWLILKDCHGPYPSLCQAYASNRLKKDYIHGSGDITDLAIVG